jgi:hypothetical protein
VRVARGEQRAWCIHGQKQPGSSYEMLDVDIATLLPGRNCAQRLGGDRWGAGDCPYWIGYEYGTTGIECRLLAGQCLT